MELTEAINFIKAAIPNQKGTWADIGAGSGLFTQALDQLLVKESTIYAIDQNTATLKNLPLINCKLEVINQDYNQPFEPLELDGILMANALHFSSNPKATLENVLSLLKLDGRLIVIEYELNEPRAPWIPYPITLKKLSSLAQELNLSSPKEIARMPSKFGHQYMYLAIIGNDEL